MTIDAPPKTTAEFDLPVRLDTDTASELREDLIAMRGADISIHANEVTHLGAQCLAVLIAAVRSWEADGFNLTVSDFSEDFQAGLARMGAASGVLPTGEATA